MLEIGGGVIAVPVVHFYVAALHSDRDLAESPIFGGIGTSISEDVVHGSVLDHLRVCRMKIVGVEKGAATRAGCQRHQRFLG